MLNNTVSSNAGQMEIVAGITGSGERIKIKGTSLTPNADMLVLTIDGSSRMSVEYAKARDAINKDHAILFASNQALAKKMRSNWKRRVVEALGGKVSKNEKLNLIVTFKDGSIARL
jgi:hypothetical protein